MLHTLCALSAHTYHSFVRSCVDSIRLFALGMFPSACATFPFPGPISKPEDAKYVLRSSHDVHGFYGASSMERLPVETAIADCVKLYKGITLYDSDEESNHV